jgi:hypothetical protein
MGFQAVLDANVLLPAPPAATQTSIRQRATATGRLTGPLE